MPIKQTCFTGPCKLLLLALENLTIHFMIALSEDSVTLLINLT
jgi:hypothetical protein